jgi:hypothetical protein
MDVRGYIGENAASFFGAPREWLAIPSISADPAHHADVRRSADWLAAHLRQAAACLWDELAAVGLTAAR